MNTTAHKGSRGINNFKWYSEKVTQKVVLIHLSEMGQTPKDRLVKYYNTVWLFGSK